GVGLAMAHAVKWMRRISVLPAAAAVVVMLSLPSAAAAEDVAAPAPLRADSALPYRLQRDLTYATRGEERLLLDAWLPTGSGPFPAVLVVHGGAWRSGGKGQLAGYARSLAREGIAAFAINYRLAPRHKFPAQIEDCRDAVRWIRKHAEDFQVDPVRLGALGYSAGGHLVTLLATTAAKDTGDEGKSPIDDAAPVVKRQELDLSLQCVCAGGAPCDFRELGSDSRTLAFWLGGSPAEVPELYQAASPAAFVTRKAPPMFFFHGEEDALVPLRSPQRMVEQLRSANVEAELHVVENAGHIATFFNTASVRKSVEFFARHLRPGTQQSE
ncbi:MAG: alpha/beta hydrolase, partial [Planctomycetes bacterium]|nr:alpha/beta hydrolase [Planctomycetota bacterium]